MNHSSHPFGDTHVQPSSSPHNQCTGWPHHRHGVYGRAGEHCRSDPRPRGRHLHWLPDLRLHEDAAIVHAARIILGRQLYSPHVDGKREMGESELDHHEGLVPHNRILSRQFWHGFRTDKSNGVFYDSAASMTCIDNPV